MTDITASKANEQTLSDSEKVRYSRHLLLPEVGSQGQKKLKASSVVIIGAGGLGSPVSMYLAAAGVGTIGIVDFDKVDLTNLQRQILHSTNNVGKDKCQSAKERLEEINPEIEVIVHNEKLTASNVESIIKNYDVVVDASDNFITRYIINDACVLQNKPNVYGAIYRFEGQASIFVPQQGPCYRCLFPEPPPAEAVPNCAEAGVLGVLAGTIGCIQATETIKYLLSLGSSLSGKMIVYDAMDMRFDTLKSSKNIDCALCGKMPTITAVREPVFSCQPQNICNTTSGEDKKLTSNQTSTDEISPIALQKELKEKPGLFLLDVRNPDEYLLCNIDGSTLLPLPELQERISELDKDKDIVIYCKAGARGRKALLTLQSNGFKKVRNLTGGILAWIAEVDPSLTSY